MQRGQQGGELSRKENNLKRFRWLSIVRLFHALEAFIIYGSCVVSVPHNRFFSYKKLDQIPVPQSWYVALCIEYLPITGHSY